MKDNGYGPCLATKALIKLLICDEEGDDIYECPHCGNQEPESCHDTLGSDVGCCFCIHCNREVFWCEKYKAEHEKKKADDTLYDPKVS